MAYGGDPVDHERVPTASSNIIYFWEPKVKYPSVEEQITTSPIGDNPATTLTIPPDARKPHYPTGEFLYPWYRDSDSHKGLPKGTTKKKMGLNCTYLG